MERTTMTLTDNKKDIKYTILNVKKKMAYFFCKQRQHLDLKELMKAVFTEIEISFEQWITSNSEQIDKFIKEATDKELTTKYIVLKRLSRICQEILAKHETEMDKDDKRAYEDFISLTENFNPLE
jgi:hypothetical protein